MNSIEILNSKVSTGSYDDFLSGILNFAKNKESKYVCVANVHMLVEANRNKSFQSVLSEADLVTPDGMPLVWYSKSILGIKQERVCGMDLLPDLLKECQLNSLSVFVYGGSEKQLEATSSYLLRNYSTLKIAGLYSPPFKELPLKELNNISTLINKSGADLVLVCLGCPKQEKWMYQMKGTINAAMIGIGGALPVMVGLNKRAPLWMQKTGMEWFYRLMQEPKRLFKRYFITNTIFLYIFFKKFFLVKVLHISRAQHPIRKENIVVDL